MHGTNNIKFVALGLTCVILTSSYSLNHSKPSGNNTYHQLQNYKTWLFYKIGASLIFGVWAKG